MEALAVRENDNEGGLEKRVMGWSGSTMEGEMTAQAEGRMSRDRPRK